MHWVGPAALSGAVALALAAAWTDWRRREVPHWTVAGLLGAWLLAVVLAPEALGFDPWAGLLCGGVGLVTGLVCHGFGWLGGGDAKLLGVLALWLGPRDLPIAFAWHRAVWPGAAAGGMARPDRGLPATGHPLCMRDRAADGRAARCPGRGAGRRDGKLKPLPWLARE